MDKNDPQQTASQEAALARLRAADPAAAAETDLTALRAAVQERWDAAPADELARRRWTGWPVRAAAAAAAALVIGGGGFALGNAGAGEPAAAVITLGGPAEASDALGPEPLSRVAGESDMSIWPGYWSRTVFTASGLSGAGGVASAWGFDPSAVFNEATVAAAAAALGVSGTPQLVDGMWTVGPNDGSAAIVQLYPDGTAGLNYYDPTKDVWRCAVTAVEEPAPDGEGSSGAEGSEVLPAPDPCTEQDLGPAAQGDAAISVLRDAMSALGVDPGEFEFVTEDSGDPTWSWVTAYQVVQGQRSGVAWSASLTGAGLQSLYGSAAPLVELGEYQVISPAEAVARLADPRFGVGSGGFIAMERVGAVDDAMVSSGSVPSLPGTVAAGAQIQWPVERVTIVEARLGLALHTQVDGAALLVPTYELTSDDGGVWAVIAVVDSHLDFSSVR